jgi:hypothetical protein
MAKGKIKKAAHAAAFAPISRFSAMKSTKRSAIEAAVTIAMNNFLGLASASWGKPKKQIQATRPTLVTESADKVV